MCEAKPGGACTTTETPEVVNDDFQLALKLKLLKLDSKTRPLAPPKNRSANPAPVLREGTPEEAGVSADAKEKIDAVCQRWVEESGEPLSVLVARHGVIITHAAFGKDSDGTPMTTDFRTELASLTKAISGVLFSRFLEQGYVTLDEPIGNRLPGFPVKGSKMLTYRNLFTHTTGLNGHGEWGGLHNPHLENVILNGLPSLRPGTQFAYNGMGYDLAGKAMEVMTGTSIIRLFHEGLYRPLGIANVPMRDMAFSAEMTSHELAVIGQLLANHGSYGSKEFISEETFNKLLPEPLSKYYPKIDLDWGIGLTWYGETKDGVDETKDGTRGSSTDPKNLILGKRVIGHGSATSCILRVDLDNDLVIAQVRRTHGPKYEEQKRKFLQAVADSLR
jgi:CubicO group peptidase (beta-lactamase class C family)